MCGSAYICGRGSSSDQGEVPYFTGALLPCTVLGWCRSMQTHMLTYLPSRKSSRQLLPTWKGEQCTCPAHHCILQAYLLLQSDAAGELDSLCKGSHICGGPWYGCESFCVQQNVFNKTLELIRSRSDVTKPALQLLKHKPISIQFYKPEFDEEYVRYVLLHGWWVDEWRDGSNWSFPRYEVGRKKAVNRTVGERQRLVHKVKREMKVGNHRNSN